MSRLAVMVMAMTLSVGSAAAQQVSPNGVKTVSPRTLDHEKVLTALRHLDIQTISGRLRFYRKGENRNPNAAWQGTLNPFPTQIQDGREPSPIGFGHYVTVWPPQFAAGKHTYPRAGSTR